MTGAVSEKSLFHSLSSNDAVLPELLADFSQRLPMPTAESGGVCFDLWANSIPQVVVRAHTQNGQ